MPAKLGEHVPVAVAILDTIRRDHLRPEQPQRINDNVPLPTDGFFSRIVAAGSALLGCFDALAAEGFGVLHACRRTRSRSWSGRFVQVPLGCQSRE